MIAVAMGNGQSSSFLLRSCICCGFLALGGLLVGSPTVAQGADLSKDIRTASDEGQYAGQITAYVQEKVTAIGQDADTAGASKARESLVDNVRGFVPPSAAFLDAYEGQLNSALANLLVPAKNSIRVRLNAAIVVASVAQASQDAQLAQLVITELNDPSEAVVLWGLKAAHEVIPPALGVPSLKVQLISAVQKAAQRLGSGPIVNAAYIALAVGDKPPASPIELIGPVQSLLDWRTRQYATAVPPEPPADATATAFLTEREVWLRQSPGQRTATVQRIIDLLAAAITALPAAQQDDHDQLIVLLKKTGQAIFVIGLNTGDVALQTAATPLSNIDSRPPPMPPAAAALKAVQALASKFPGLRIPKAFPASSTSPSAAVSSAP